MPKKAIFIHIPKTAGSTFTQLLVNNYAEEERFPTSWSNILAGRGDGLDKLDSQHQQQLRLIYGHQPFGNQRYLSGESHYITFLREPVDRAISHYYFLNGNAPNRDALFQHLLYDYQSRWNGLPTIYLISNFQTRWLSNALFGMAYATEEDMLEAALKNLEQMEVGLVERFDESVDRFCRLLQLSKAELVDEKVSQTRPRMHELPEPVMTRLRQINQLDEKLYQRARQRFGQSLARMN